MGNKYVNGCCDVCEHGGDSLEFYPEACEGCDGASGFSVKLESLYGLLSRDCWIVEKERIISCRIGGLSYKNGTAYISVDPRTGGAPCSVNACNIGRILFFNRDGAEKIALNNRERK